MARRTGRPTNCTRALADALGELVAGGLPPVSAAAHLGVARSTFHTWVRRGEQFEGVPAVEVPVPERPFVHFVDVLRRSEAEDERRLVAIVQAHAASGQPDSWRAARFALERRHRESWAESRSAGTAAAMDAKPPGTTLRDLLNATPGNTTHG